MSGSVFPFGQTVRFAARTLLLPVVVTLLVFTSGCTDVTAPPTPPGGDGQPLGVNNLPGQGTGRFGPDMVILLGEDENPTAVARAHGIAPEFVFDRVVRGFSGSISDLARSGLLKDHRVRDIVRNQTFSIEGETAHAPSWGLDRIDQRELGFNQTYQYETTGLGVTAYIVDTGVRFTHYDFGGRATLGFDAYGGDGSDCNGHGTHVAGTVGGTSYGVAKDASLVSVRVMGCSGGGSLSTILAGLDWIAANAQAPAVVNMSIGGAANDVLDAAVAGIIASGISVVVAAGNSSSNACEYSPGRLPEALTVGATTNTDLRAGWSNWGLCLDWFAPGDVITSAGHQDDAGAAVKSGTSMAAPHTTGAVALYLETHPEANPTEIAAALAARTTKGVVGGSFSPASDLLYTLDDGTDPTGGNAAPVADFSVTCTDLTCQFTDQSSDLDGTVVGWQWVFGDGTGGLDPSPTHTYPNSGTFETSLIVRDNQGATTPMTVDVEVGNVTDPPPPPPPPPANNQLPNAAFTSDCTGVVCQFENQSTDADGNIVQSTWDFGDGNSQVVQSQGPVQHSFSTSGWHTVTLTVVDDAGGSASMVHDVAVGLNLAVQTSKSKGRHVLDIAWIGAQSTEVDIHVSGLPSVRAPNNGDYRYLTNNRGQGSYTVRVCEAGGTGVCSPDKTVNF